MYKTFSIFTFLLFSLFSTIESSSDIGSFFHISDFHYNPLYDQFGNVSAECTSFANKSNGFKDLGSFGNHLCDPPFKLIKSCLEAMQKELPNPDWIIWTGDSFAHLAKGQFNFTDVVNAIGNMTEELSRAFPQVDMYPVFGNHDFFPKNEAPEHKSEIYEKVYQIWAPFLQKHSKFNVTTFLNCGYYKLFMKQLNVTLVGLNTNLYLSYNPLVKTYGADPCGQFKWLENEFLQARKTKTKIITVAHVPPGYFEDFEAHWFRLDYNLHFYNLFKNYYDVFLWNFYAHTHTDTMRLIPNPSGGPGAALMLGPSVTPTYKNPTFRIFDYNKKTKQIIDVRTFYMDLNAANSKGIATWKLEYSFKTDYGLSPVTTDRIFGFFDSLWKNDSLFVKYVDHNSAMLKLITPKPTEKLKLQELCPVQHVDTTSYDKCKNAAKIPVFSLKIIIVEFSVVMLIYNFL